MYELLAERLTPGSLHQSDRHIPFTSNHDVRSELATSLTVDGGSTLLLLFIFLCQVDRIEEGMTVLNEAPSCAYVVAATVSLLALAVEELPPMTADNLHKKVKVFFKFLLMMSSSEAGNSIALKLTGLRDCSSS